MKLIVPHWNAARAYGDYTHREPVSETWLGYLNKSWRGQNAPHNTLYLCNFEGTYGYTLAEKFQNQSLEEQAFAALHFRDASVDLFFDLVCVK